MSRVPRSFYERQASVVARELIGLVLVRQLPEATLRGLIVETEAYTGQTDPGSHAFRGPTPRNRVMFGPAGFLYVYLSYGMHYCMNVVTDVEGVAGAVLLRALEPLDGSESMQRRRGRRPLVDLCNGPAKLCTAFGVTREENGANLETSDIWVERVSGPAPPVENTTRIGLSAGADLPLRFYASDNRFISRAKPSLTPTPRRRSARKEGGAQVQSDVTNR